MYNIIEKSFNMYILYAYNIVMCKSTISKLLVIIYLDLFLT